MAIFVLYNLSLKIYPKIFPTEENLNIKEWSTYTEYRGEEPFFTIKYPKGWQAKISGSGGWPHTEIRSPWNNKNNKDKNFIYINIQRDSKKGWGGSGDPVIGSDLNDIKVPIIDKYFEKGIIDRHEAFYAKSDIINKDYFNNKNGIGDAVYIFTNTPLFQEDTPSPENNSIIRFEMTYDTKQNPEKIKKIYGQIVNSFNYLE